MFSFHAIWHMSISKNGLCGVLFFPVLLTSMSHRVAKFACPRVLDDQKMSEDNQKMRSGCPPDYQIFWENILKIIVHTHFLRILFSPFPFPTNVYHFGNLKQIAYYMVLK